MSKEIDFDREREAFEAWMRQTSASLDRHPPGDGHWALKYRDHLVESAWEGWKGRAVNGSAEQT